MACNVIMSYSRQLQDNMTSIITSLHCRADGQTDRTDTRLTGSCVVCMTGSCVTMRRVYDMQAGDYDALDDVTNRLILKLVDVAIQDAMERGASPAITENLMRKRSGLRKCFFHAINCW